MSISLILTHPGGAHKDEFLACCLLAAVHGAPVARREPSPADLDNPATAVVDVGHRHEPALSNFDHHQLPPEHPPCCALSLVLQHLGIYEDALEFCPWLETAEWFDSRGPVETGRMLGVDRETLAKLQSPIDVTLIRRFAREESLTPGQPLWEVMSWIGRDLIDFVRELRQRLDAVAAVAEEWTFDSPRGPLRALFLPRADGTVDDPSATLARYADSLSSGEDSPPLAALVYPDRRGSGYGLSRHLDHPALDFSRIAGEADVHFAHARGFVAKSSATDPARLRELLALAAS